MNTIKNYIALSLSVLVLGCTSYPEHGTGGLAESYDSMNYQNSDFSPVMPDEPLGPEHGLRFDWQLAKLHLDALIQEGARWCFPLRLSKPSRSKIASLASFKEAYF